MKNIAFYAIRDLISAAMYSFQDFVDYIKMTFAQIQINALTAKAKSQEAADYSGNAVNGLQFYANNVNTHFMTCMRTSKELIQNKKITELLQNLNQKVSSLADNAYKLPEMSLKIQNTIKEVDSDVSTKVDEYDTKFTDTINSVDFSEVYKITGKVEEYSEPAKAASNTVTIFGIIFSVMIIVTYTIIYFMYGKWCRCLSCWFPTFGVAFAIFLGVPAIFFSFLVVFFEGSCPHMDSFVENIAKDSFSPKAKNISALYCSGADKSLYSLLDLESMFDVNTLLHQFNDTVKNEITKVESDPTLVKTLDQVAAINTSQFSLDGIIEIIGMKELLKYVISLNPLCKRETLLDQAVDDYFYRLEFELIPMLQKMMDSVTNSVNYAKKIGPEIERPGPISENPAGRKERYKI
ncbi:hypothetical protein TVAG_126730 [Trichomonas vaginalis G3]|uniref:Prominin n=1 Tax=Trichomonas vaginalis (strain ATCC PRA-98 / G3) TaxID=412133 RepID=A2FHT3_TRIV3|nr:hypothetical protein TVAGG3_0460740 [Trichomonas vaginalis G3]EAX95543.1 hypothetical protein TVAG_126730 [Trichomonas vaginalis G3]KAI5514398.1 hypothetical protein TVAGG3_0460740 [Trichomonas vaginalis G3]|eukprot:XP_001308473.1 hypothetical protein [Trichomonas vaginalis G3]